SLLRTITQVVAQTSVRSPGRRTSHYLPICKGPVLAAISADEFRRAPTTSSSHPHAPSLPRGRVLPSALLDSRVRGDLPPIHQRPVVSPFSDIGTKKDA